MAVVFGQYPHWPSSDAQGREVRQALYKVLLEILAAEVQGPAATREGPANLKQLVDQILALAGQWRG